ncbi:glycosyltransferase family 4 protein [Nocardioides baekrokdamisoli]|nr:glycosyltransferase [Nocardioides baekrokdamisoli]
MKVLRMYHAGRDAAHRERDRALAEAGADLTLVVPSQWPGPDHLGDEDFRVIELPVLRPGDINRHTYADPRMVADLIADLTPDVVDIHEEPYSAAMHQLLGLLGPQQAVVAYTAQNIDKRFPPPFARWERAALRRLNGLYPCSRQAASVAIGKGYAGPVEVLPLAAPAAMTAGDQRLDGDLRLLLVGRMVPEKGVLDAVRLLADARLSHARLQLVGEGPEVVRALELAAALGVRDRLDISGWLDAGALATHYRRAHIVLAPSRSTRSWTEQFGRMVVEAQACGAVVVGYASGALDEVIGNAGLTVPEGDEQALAAAVAGLATDPSRWNDLRTRGFELAATRTWDAVARHQMALYERALAGPAPTASGRAAARETWGAPALDGVRPWALPHLADRVRTRILGADR